MAEAADRIGSTLEAADWLEAFAAHPKIGAGAGRGSGGAGRAGGAGGQEGPGPSRSRRASALAADATLRRLADANRDYEARFGYIFIVCATGKTAAEMLALLERRLRHDAGDELRDRRGGAAEDHADSTDEAARDRSRIPLHDYDTRPRHRARRAGGRRHGHPRAAPGQRMGADRAGHHRRERTGEYADRRPDLARAPTG